MTLSKETSGFTRRETFLPFSPPAISEQEIEAVVDTLRSSWITTGPRTKQFEADFTPSYTCQVPKLIPIILDVQIYSLTFG